MQAADDGDGVGDAAVIECAAAQLNRPGLVLEGGTFRPVFSCGVMDALLDHDIMFDYVVGVSAGILPCE